MTAKQTILPKHAGGRWWYEIVREPQRGESVTIDDHWCAGRMSYSEVNAATGDCIAVFLSGVQAREFAELNGLKVQE